MCAGCQAAVPMQGNGQPEKPVSALTEGCHTRHQPLPGKQNVFSLLSPDVSLATVQTGGVALVAISATGLAPKSQTAKPKATLSPKQPVRRSSRTPPDVAYPVVTGGISLVQDEKCPRLIKLNARYQS